MGGVLTGTRVLDFGRYIAGPWCAALLGDMGADVIRIDKIGGSEDRFVLPVSDGLDGGMFLQMNRNKRSMTLASKGVDRNDILKRLVETADVVVANMPDKALTALGIDYESLTAIKPDIVLTTVSAYGSSGPFADKVGFDVVAQAMSGSMHLTGHEGDPMRSCVSWVDFGTATLCAFGTMAALMERQTSGKGQHVRGSLLATALTTANSYLIEQALTGADRTATGNRSQIAAPADVFRTTDGHIVMQAVGNPMFHRWAELVGAQDWIEDPRFKDDEARANHGQIISARMQDWCVNKSTTDALAALEQARLPGAPVLTPQEALDHPQINGSDSFSHICQGQNGQTVPIVNTPVSLSRTPGEVRLPPPPNGAHTREILLSLGFDDEDVNRFDGDGTI